MSSSNISSTPPRPDVPAHETGAKVIAAHQADVNQYLAAYIMGIANRLANGASNHYRRHFNLGMSEWRALMAIGTHTDRIVREVAEMADLDYAAASKSLKLLQERGLVSVTPTNRRGRAALASLTPEGLELYRKIRKEAKQREKRLISAFTPAELDQLWGLLRTVESQIREMNAES